MHCNGSKNDSTVLNFNKKLFVLEALKQYLNLRIQTVLLKDKNAFKFSHFILSYLNKST